MHHWLCVIYVPMVHVRIMETSGFKLRYVSFVQIKKKVTKWTPDICRNLRPPKAFITFAGLDDVFYLFFCHWDGSLLRAPRQRITKQLKHVHTITQTNTHVPDRRIPTRSRIQTCTAETQTCKRHGTHFLTALSRHTHTHSVTQTVWRASSRLPFFACLLRLT